MAKAMYIGVSTEFPIYSSGGTINITGDNITDYFTVTNGTYYFKWNSSSNAFASSNIGVGGSTATSTWKAINDISNLSFTYSYSSESGWDKFTLTIAGTTVENAVSGSTTIKSWSGSLTAGQTIVLTYSKDSSVDRNDDVCKVYNITADIRVQTGTYIRDVAKKVKKAYVGIDNIARKIKKMYIGVNGMARCIFHNDQKLSYYGTATSLSSARYLLAATSVGNYALFGGGYRSGSTYSSVVNSYDTNLTRGTPTSLIYSRGYLAATSVGNYALFGGGSDGDEMSTVDAYDTSLTRTNPANLNEARYYLAATSVGNYALFGGGSGYGYSSTVDAYDTSLTRTNPTGLCYSRDRMAATSVGNYALFGGGTSANGTNLSVDVYNSSLTRTNTIYLTTQKSMLSATNIGDYAIFGGGYDGSTHTSTVDAYDTSLTQTTTTELSLARYRLAATSVGNYALFGGGYTSTYVSNVDVYQIT
jgi:hypothetical protein